MEFKFGTMSIYDIGLFISNRLREDGITNKAELSIYVSEDEFKKIDEDLYYRNRVNDEQDFIPSEGEIIVNFDMVKIIVKQS